MAANLKKVVAQYCSQHKVEATVNKLVNRLVLERPDDPYALLSQLFAAESKAPRGVLRAEISVVLDEHGQSVFQLAITLNSGVYYGQQSTGLKPVTPQVELPQPKDPDEEEPEEEEPAPQQPLVLAHIPGNMGEEVQAMLKVVRANLLPKLIGKEPTDQAKWDTIIAGACQDVPASSPETEAAKRAISMACSIAVCKAGAAIRKLPIYRHIADAAKRVDDVFLPVPAVSVVTGGDVTTAEGNRAPMNEIYALPVGATSFREAISLGRRVHERVKVLLSQREGAVLDNKLGSFDAVFEDLKEALQIVHTAILTTGCGDRVKIGLAMAASRLFSLPSAVELEGFPEDDIPGTYDLGTDEGRLTTVQLTQQYNALMLEFPIVMLEDPFDAFPDPSGSCRAWVRYVEEMGRNVHIVANGLVGKDPEKVAKVGDEKACNGATVHWVDYATVSEALDFTSRLQEQYWGIILRDDLCTCSETFTADFAVGAQFGNYRAGGVRGLGHVVKYNRMLQISDEMAKDAEYVGSRFLSGLSS